MYKSYVGLLCSAVGPLPPIDYTPQQAEVYLALRHSRISSVSLSVELRTPKAVISKLRRIGVVKKNPFQYAQVEVEQHAPVAFTRDEFALFTSAIPQDWFPKLITVCAYSGMRREEALQLHL